MVHYTGREEVKNGRRQEQRGGEDARVMKGKEGDGNNGE